MAFLIHWNCRGLINNYSDVKDLLNTFSPFVICLQETNLGPEYKNILKNYKVFRCDREQSGRLSGGVAIVIQSGVATRQIKLKTKYEAVAVTTLLFKTITICCLYLQPHSPVNLHDLEELLDQLPEPYLVVGDFNAHSSFWGSELTDTRGRILEDFILCNNICLLNTGKQTYCSPSSGKMSCLDLSLCSPSIFNYFKWDVIDNPYGSDHLLLLLSFYLLHQSSLLNHVAGSST